MKKIQRIYIFFLLITISLLFAQSDVPPIAEVNRIGKIEVYNDGIVYYYDIFEIVNKKNNTVRAYLFLRKKEEKYLNYKNYTILKADFQNLKLGTVLVSLAKIINANVLFGKDLWKTFQMSREVISAYQETPQYTVEISTSEVLTSGMISGGGSEKSVPESEKREFKESIKSSELIKIPAYLFQDVSLVINSPTPAYTLFNTILREYDLMAVKLSRNLIKISLKDRIEFNVSGIDEKDVKKFLQKLKRYSSSVAKIVYDKDLGKIIVIDTKENIEKLKSLRISFEKSLKTKGHKEVKPKAKVLYFKNRRDLEIAKSLINQKFGDIVVVNEDRDFNALIVYSVDEKILGKVENLIGSLTTNISSSYITTKVFYVRYIPLHEIKKKIEPLLSEEGEVYILKVGNVGGENEEGGSSSGEDIVDVSIERGNLSEGQYSLKRTRKIYLEFNNAILIKDYPERIREIYKKYRKFLSEKPIKIKIKARILEISKDIRKELGISSRQISLSQTSVPRFWSSDISSEVDLAKDTATAGLLTFIFQKGILNALNLKLKAFEYQGKARIIAEPYILTLNGETALISSDIEWPYIQNASVNQTTGIVQPSVEYKSIPITLSVTPVVLPNSEILLDLDIIRGRIIEIKRYSTGATIAVEAPVVATSRLNIKIPVREGSTVVIGGVVEKEKRSIEEGVPKLKEVPLFGWLFKGRQTDIQNRELLIFITPEILEEE